MDSDRKGRLQRDEIDLSEKSFSLMILPLAMQIDKIANTSFILRCEVRLKNDFYCDRKVDKVITNVLLSNLLVLRKVFRLQLTQF